MRACPTHIPGCPGTRCQRQTSILARSGISALRSIGSGALRKDLTACPGSASYLVFLFSSNGLFRLSYRLIADKGCADTNAAAQAIFARYVPIGQSVAMSVRYRTGNTEVVDVTDPAAGYLVPIRWRQGRN